MLQQISFVGSFAHLQYWMRRTKAFINQDYYSLRRLCCRFFKTFTHFLSCIIVSLRNLDFDMQKNANSIQFNYRSKISKPNGLPPSHFPHFLRESFLHFYISLLVAIVVRLWRYDWVVCTRKRKPLFTLLFPNKMDVQKLPPFTSFPLPKICFSNAHFPLRKMEEAKVQ